MAGDQPILSAQRSSQQNGPYKVLRRQEVWVVYRPSLHGGHHGSGVRLVNTTDGVFLKIYRKVSGSGNVKCHVFIISVSQMNIMEKQVQSVLF